MLSQILSNTSSLVVILLRYFTCILLYKEFARSIGFRCAHTAYHNLPVKGWNSFMIFFFLNTYSHQALLLNSITRYNKSSCFVLMWSLSLSSSCQMLSLVFITKFYRKCLHDTHFLISKGTEIVYTGCYAICAWLWTLWRESVGRE